MSRYGSGPNPNNGKFCGPNFQVPKIPVISFHPVTLPFLECSKPFSAVWYIGRCPWGHPVRSYPLCYYYQLLGCTEAPQGHESLMLGKRRRKSLWMIWVGKKTILGAASQSRERETEDGRSLFVLWKFLWHARAEQCDRMKLIWSRSRTLGILWSNISRRTKDNHNT